MNTAAGVVIRKHFYIFFALLLMASSAQGKNRFSLVWANYIGTAPWGYAAEQGIIQRWADKYKIQIDVRAIREDERANEAFFQRKLDAVTATNIDILSNPKANSSQSTALIIGSYSNGNDGLVSRSLNEVKQLQEQSVYLSQHSIAHYLLYRALFKYGVDHTSVTIIDTPNSQLETVFKSNPNSTVATWNPKLQRLQDHYQGRLLFSSAQISGEILDITYVHADADERFKRALTGAWYEVMDILQTPKHREHQQLMNYLAKQGNTSIRDIVQQLETTSFYMRARRAAALARSPSIKATMEYARHFTHHRGLLNSADAANHIGIRYPDGTINGADDRVILNFTDRYMLMAANQQL